MHCPITDISRAKKQVRSMWLITIYTDKIRKHEIANPEVTCLKQDCKNIII